jgi:hypothetical protein
LPKAKSRRRSGGDQVFMYMSIVVDRQFPEDCSASDEFSGGNDADESDRRMDHRFRETLTFQQLLAERSDLGKSRY